MIYQTQNLFIFLILLELFEFFWQKGDNLKEFIQNLFKIYEKSVIFFISLHLSFFFIIFCIFGLNLNSLALYFIALAKFLDICFKIFLLDKIEKNLSLGEFEMLIRHEYPLSIPMKLIPLFTYGSIFYFYVLNF